MDSTAPIQALHDVGCLLCGSELAYAQEARNAACALCGRSARTTASCSSAGHFVCDTCHSSDARDLIERVCTESASTDPLSIAVPLMRAPGVCMHGPEHHFLVPAVLLAAYCNAAGKSKEEKKAAIALAKTRSASVPGGWCGYYGACGGCIGTGLFTAIVQGSTPLHKAEWGIANTTTGKALCTLGSLGGPRCCKRSVFNALLVGTRTAKSKLGVDLHAEKPLCSFFSKNQQCLGNRCPFHPRASEEIKSLYDAALIMTDECLFRRPPFAAALGLPALQARTDALAHALAPAVPALLAALAAAAAAAGLTVGWVDDSRCAELARMAAASAQWAASVRVGAWFASTVGAIRAGGGPDVIVYDSQWMGLLVKERLLLDVSLPPPRMYQDLQPSRFYGVGLTGNIPVLFYRSSMLANRSDLSLSSWSDVLRAAAALRSGGMAGFVTGWCSNTSSCYDSFIATLNQVIWDFGGTQPTLVGRCLALLTDRRLAGEVWDPSTYRVDGVLDSNSAVDALAFLRQLAATCGCGANVTARQALEMVCQGSAAIAMSFTSYWPAAACKYRADIAFAPVPATRYYSYAGHGIGVNARSQNTERAIEFVQWAVSYDVQLAWVRTGGGLSSRKDILIGTESSLNASELYHIYSQKLPFAKDFWRLPEALELMALHTKWTSLAVQGLYPLVEALNVTAEQEQRLINKWHPCGPDDCYSTSTPHTSRQKTFIIEPSELEFSVKIGCGASSEVFMGSWRGTKVAVKRRRLQQLTPADVRVFESEVEVMRLLRHPNIVLWMCYSLKPDYLFIVTELMANGSLADVLSEKALKLSLRTKLNIMHDAALGLNYLHSCSPPILHCDIRAQNFLLDTNFNCKISDFGLSRLRTIEHGGEINAFFWHAPEVLRGEPYTEKADVYSFGMVFWETLTAKTPFYGMNPHYVIHKIITEGIRPDFPVSCPFPLSRLIRACWDQDMHKRIALSHLLDDWDKLMSCIPEQEMGKDWLSSLPMKNVCIVAAKVRDVDVLREWDHEMLCSILADFEEVVTKLCVKFEGEEIRSGGTSPRSTSRGYALCVFQDAMNAIGYSMDLLQEASDPRFSKPLESSDHDFQVGIGIHYGDILSNSDIMATGQDAGPSSSKPKDTEIACNLCAAASEMVILVSHRMYQEALAIDCVGRSGTFESWNRAEGESVYQARDRPQRFIPRHLHLTPRKSSDARAKYTDEMEQHRPNWLVPFSEIQADMASRPIGVGNYGEVYKGTWRGQTVAVKIFLNQHVDRERVADFKEQFKEIALLGDLRHPNVLLFMCACMDPPHICMVTEFMDAGNLHEALRKPQEQFAWARFDHIGNVKIADFGLSTIKAANAVMTACGSVHWTAPEILSNSQYSFPIDVYSIIMWEILTRANPYTGMRLPGVLTYVLSAVAEEFPAGYVPLMQGCWAQAPAERPLFGQIVQRVAEMSTGAATDTASTPCEQAGDEPRGQ
eukprot:m51a1_g1482 putative sam-dependent methyltransferase (1464) ;mRNA; f:283082-290674